uniref:Uncharacterized protein n=1 Tax=Anguilla anguilla TaxID=7936 RepID=A0A0E9WVC2_ANGAN
MAGSEGPVALLFEWYLRSWVELGRNGDLHLHMARWRNLVKNGGRSIFTVSSPFQVWIHIFPSIFLRKWHLAPLLTARDRFMVYNPRQLPKKTHKLLLRNNLTFIASRQS